MKLTEITEGLFDRFRKKPEPQMLPITLEQHALIKQFFKNSNVDVKYGNQPDSKYVIEQNVHAYSGRGKISFRNEDGVLIASVAYHRSEADATNPRARPIAHYDATINSPADMEKLIKELS
jgi:hypothetical protein